MTYIVESPSFARVGLIVFALSALATPALAQDWLHRPGSTTGLSPIDIAAQARAERERLRSGLDERRTELQVQQLRADQIIQRLEADRGPALLGAQGAPGTEPEPILSYSDPRDRMSVEEMTRRLDALDARARRNP